MEIIAYASVAYLVVRIIVALVNYLTGQYLKPGRPEAYPLVSVLIPARNEEKNIGLLLEDLINLDYLEYEILVYDDDSNDHTAQIVTGMASQNPRIRYIHGSGPEQGWLGKNFACDQLARQSQGDYLLFLDADVRVTPEIIKDSLAFMQHHGLSLLSMFPVQIMKTWGEWLTVPMMNRILVGNLPMFMVQHSRLAAFSAANGQFMMFDANVYKRCRFHEMVKAEMVEDIRIARIMKKLGLRIHTLLSGGQVSCRMYQGYREGISGFSKNIYAFFGNSWFLLLLFNLLSTLGPVATWLAFSFPAMLAYVAALVAFSILVSLQSRQAVWRNIFLMPLQQLFVIIISLSAAFWRATGKLSWKGRSV